MHDLGAKLSRAAPAPLLVAPLSRRGRLPRIDERYFAPRPARDDGEPYVLAVGKDLARDYATFADAVRRLGVRAEIAAYPRNLQGLRLPAGTRARAVPPAELRELYAGASCVVVPQRRQEYPYGSEGGDRWFGFEGVREETALLVPPEDPEALAAAIGRVLGDADLAWRLSEAGRSRVEAELTTRHFAKRLAPILRAAAG